MNKRLLLSAVAGFSMFLFQDTFAQNTTVPNTGVIRCGTDQYVARLKQQDPTTEGRMQKIEGDIQTWIINNRKNPKPMAVVTIPVVVHVVWNTATQNIPDIYIQQQIDELNKNYRKLNSDWTKINTANPNWASLVADCEIEFCLATVDPSGNPTSGIIRVNTTDASFSDIDNQVKFTSQGGSNAWPSSQYLNLWVCNLSGGLLGYAQPPGAGAANTDGVVVLYSSLPGPPASPNGAYDLGRSATHEIGHWLNLIHTFQGGCSGLTSSNCATSGDRICDTPPLANYTFGCPSTTSANSCNETSPFPPPFTSDQPNMWMNFMDYTDDPCMYMFTEGQKTRMTAVINGTRASLKTSAVTKCAVLGVNETLPSKTVTVYPNPSSGDLFLTFDNLAISSAEIIIFNTIGVPVLEKKMTVSSGREVRLDMGGNPNGIYLLQMKSSEGTITKKVVINK